jgi:TolA-binding protein
LREQIERVQQEQAALHARIDSVRDELRELREVRQPSPSRLIAGESKKQQSLPVERNTSSSTLSSVATTDPFDDVIAPDGDEVPSSSAPKKINSRSGARSSSAASLSSRASGASRASTSKEIAKRPEVASTKDGIKDKETSTANKPFKGSSGPADVVDLFSQAMELFKRKQYAECITLLQKSNARSASTESLARNSYWIGESCFGLGKYEDAIRWYKKALGYPAFDRASGSMLMIAESYVRMGKNSEAKKSYERVVKTYPKSAEAVRALKRLQQI